MDIRILIRYDHVLAAEYIAWTHQGRYPSRFAVAITSSSV